VTSSVMVPLSTPTNSLEMSTISACVPKDLRRSRKRRRSSLIITADSAPHSLLQQPLSVRLVRCCPTWLRWIVAVVSYILLVPSSKNLCLNAATVRSFYNSPSISSVHPRTFFLADWSKISRKVRHKHRGNANSPIPILSSRLLSSFHEEDESDDFHPEIPHNTSNESSLDEMEDEVTCSLTDDNFTGTKLPSNDDNPIKDAMLKDSFVDSSFSSPPTTPTVVPSAIELQFMQRVVQLEQLVSAQQVQIRQLSTQIKTLTETAESFGSVISFLREALNNNATQSDADRSYNISPMKTNHSKVVTGTSDADAALVADTRSLFGTAPATVMDAADAAGAAILAGLLAGKQRMLVDVRDAELSFQPEHSETLVQFIELAILPVAAGLEGLRSRRNRLKVVFPTVSHLLTYRKSMALSAPDVVALSTLGFDPVEQKDNLVVILVPSPEDAEGLTAMNELLASQSIAQPVVVINHHMVPVTGPAATFEVAYHLRLLSVQYMSGDGLPEEDYFRNRTDSAVVDMIQETAKLSKYVEDLIMDDEFEIEEATMEALNSDDDTISLDMDDSVAAFGMNSSAVAAALLRNDSKISTPVLSTAFEQVDTPLVDVDVVESSKRHDEEVEAAVKHAHAIGFHHGTTRAMVIRAYPRAWHVFVDTSPDTDADFEVAAIFADEPRIDQVNAAIIECIEGSELEDELVAQQMQQALEAGQLDRISELLASMGLDDLDDDDDDDDPYRSMFGEDTV
jgi:Domain of unknown function (DUF1995)